MKTLKISRKRRTWIAVVAGLVAAGMTLAGCAALETKKPSALTATDRGTVVYLDKYEFKAPPQNWSLLKNLEGGDFEIGFLLMEKGTFPSQTTFIFDDEPFGSSPELGRRSEQYCTRFLFNTGMYAQVQKKEEVQVMGLPALAIYMEGDNPNRDEKAKSKIYLVKKGGRIISFVCTQWRPLNGAYDPRIFEYFESFVTTFKFLKPTFYEELEEKIKKSKG